jgi:hypothetical protein
MDYVGGRRTIEIPYGKRSMASLFVGIFMICWLGGWAVGWLSVALLVLAGKANTFLIFWLCGWTIGGIFVAREVYRIFRPTVPEQITLHRRKMFWDHGREPPKISLGQHTFRWQDVFKTRLQNEEFSLQDLGTLNLQKTSDGNRLTIDKGVHRIDLASHATEIEREWLFQYLKSTYA